MKNIKYLFLTIVLLIPIALITTGCTDDSMDNIEIIVTNYPNEYITKKLYENHVRAEKIDIVSKIEDICKEIDAYADEIELTRKEILKLKDLKQCKKCNYEMELEYKFCPNCGEEQKEVLENKEENSENVSNVKKENEEDK